MDKVAVRCYVLSPVTQTLVVVVGMIVDIQVLQV